MKTIMSVIVSLLLATPLASFAEGSPQPVNKVKQDRADIQKDRQVLKAIIQQTKKDRVAKNLTALKKDRQARAKALRDLRRDRVQLVRDRKAQRKVK